MLGELIPLGGGDPVPLLKEKMLVGRRESCDIILRYANVSAHHCEMFFESGYLYVRDLQSRNGVKVNGTKVQEKLVQPGDTLAISKHKFRVDYAPAELGAVGPPPLDDQSQEIMRDSLLKRAGLDHGPRNSRSQSTKRYDPTDDKAGQIKLPGQPL